jgi:AcrR family transcriptional regulator
MRKPFDDITVRDLSARAGIGYATFFRHYPSKAALLDDIASDEIRELMAFALPEVIASDTRAAALALCRQVDERRALWSVLLTGGAAGQGSGRIHPPGQLSRAGQCRGRQLAAGRSEGDFRSGGSRRDPRLVAISRPWVQCGASRGDHRPAGGYANDERTLDTDCRLKAVV